MREFFLVFIGGGFGSIVRFGLGRWISSLYPGNFPFGTLVVNITACFVLGLCIGLADHRQLISASSRLFWTVGFCGGFSTFSTFSYETLYLLQNGMTVSTGTYLAASILLCVSATAIGLYAGESF